MIPRSTALDVPPPGPGLKTVIGTAPDVPRYEFGTDTTSCVADVTDTPRSLTPSRTID
jgi:hypothetical protein